MGKASPNMGGPLLDSLASVRIVASSDTSFEQTSPNNTVGGCLVKWVGQRVRTKGRGQQLPRITAGQCPAWAAVAPSSIIPACAFGRSGHNGAGNAVPLVYKGSHPGRASGSCGPRGCCEPHAWRKSGSNPHRRDAAPSSNAPRWGSRADKTHTSATRTLPEPVACEGHRSPFSDNSV